MGIKVFTLMVVPLSLQYVFVDALTALGMTKLVSWDVCCKKSFLLFINMFSPGVVYGERCFLCGAGGGYTGGIGDKRCFFLCI